jgi:SEC-C motif-containing protein
MRCPCRKKSESVTYEACCAPFHGGVRDASTAEALMRSRYSAFVREDAAYLLGTWHASTGPPAVQFNPGQQWLLLRVIEARAEDDSATVEFMARSRVAGQSQVLQEVSRFVREDGRWYYVDGVVK